MNRKVFQILLIFISFLIFGTASGQNFDQMSSDLEELESSEKDSLITAFILEAGGLPLVEKDTAIFMVRSTGSTPKILSGFNGFLNPRYIKDPSIGQMIEIPGSKWFYFKKELALDARIFYQFVTDSIPYNDPLNPRFGFRFNMINSEIRMPDYESDTTLVENQFVDRGTLSTINVNSQTYPDRKVQVYLPPRYEQTEASYPLVLFHDGSVYIEMARVPQILNNLIASGRIPPLIAVFDDPMIRGKEYRGDSSYIQYVDQELIPLVDKHYRTMAASENRAVIGGSRGGLSALILSHSIDKFSMCGVFSPAIFPRSMDDFTGFLKGSVYRPSKVFILGAIYDGIWHQDAVALKGYFRTPKVDFSYHEISQGHNIQSWITELDTLLKAFFPTDRY